MTYNVLIAGIGGLGAISTSVILARAANIDGYKVGGIQVHGLAQRGGAVPVQVRFGKEEILSPAIPKGEADLIVGMELIEGLRYVYYVNKERTNFLIDKNKIKPILTDKYPSLEEIKQETERISKKTTFTETYKICKEKFGDSVFGNVMLLGIAIKEGFLPIRKESMIEAIKITIPSKVLDKNLEAFELGLK